MARASCDLKRLLAGTARRAVCHVERGSVHAFGFRCLGSSRNHAPDFGNGNRSFATGSRSPVDDANDELDAVFGVMNRHAPDTAQLHTEQAQSSPTHKSSVLSHVDHRGSASMVDVGEKQSTVRVATASAVVYLGATAFGLVRDNQIDKGDVLTVAKIAGINAAKQTHQLIPLCHQLMLRKVSVDLSLNEKTNSVNITALAKTDGKTGVEMEALVAASVAGLTVYDMCKAASKSITVTDIKLETKTGGKSGDYKRSGTET